MTNGSPGVAGPDELSPASAAGAWDALERFARDLQGATRTADQVRLLLEAVRDATGADAAFWYPASIGEVVQVAGPRGLSPERCREFARDLLQDVPSTDSRLLHAPLLPGPARAFPAAQSAALVRVCRSRPAWVVAVRFQPGATFTPADLRAIALARRLLLNHRQHARMQERLRGTLFGLIHCLTAAIDAKDPYTCGHSERVARIGMRLGQQMRLPRESISDIYLAGLLHDIGKIGVRDDVLQKPGPLTPDEYAHVQEHPGIGDRILSNIEPLVHLCPGVRSHHERYDGTGYPDGRAGEEIPLLARVLAVADACDAMMSARPYRPALVPEQIETILAQGAGRQWDPDVVGHFQACREEVYLICQKGIGDSVVRALEGALAAGKTGSTPDLWLGGK